MNRTAHTLYWELRTMYRPMLIVVFAVGGAFLLMGGLTWIGGLDPIDLWDGFPIAFAVAGVIFAAGSFRELSDPGTRIAFLLRPVTVWETVATRLLTTSLVLWLGFVVAFLAASVVALGSYRLLGGDGPAAAFFASGDALPLAWRALLSFLPVHAVFFFGSVYFSRHSFAKTLGSLGAWLLSYAVFTVVTVRLLFAPYIEGRRDGPSGPPSDLQVERLLEELFPILFEHPDLVRTVALTVLTVGLWLLAVLRLRETEA